MLEGIVLTLDRTCWVIFTHVIVVMMAFLNSDSWFSLTGKDLIDQTISLFSGTHFTLPTVVLNLGESASVGTGMWISTLLAVERLLNWLFAWHENQTGQI